MDVTLTTAQQLTRQHLEAWSQFQREDASLESPYFRPEFTLAVAAVRRDVEVAVLHRDADLVGFFPFQRARRNVGRPVGGRVSDYHGVIARRGTSWGADELVRACDLATWGFDHVPIDQCAFVPYQRVTDLSPYLDLTSGFEAYRAMLGRSGANELRQTMRKARKLEKEVGPLRFEPCEQAPEVLRALLAWKTAQYRRTRSTDVFSFPWVVELLRRLLKEQEAAFSGVLSALYAGDQLISVHMGMRSYGVLHWWFPTYNPRCGAYSPGRILLAKLAQHARDLGIRRIDLGRGVAGYKRRAMSGAVTVAEGSVDLRPVVRHVREGWRQAQDWVRSSPLRGPARLPGRFIHHLSEWMEFR